MLCDESSQQTYRPDASLPPEIRCDGPSIGLCLAKCQLGLIAVTDGMEGSSGLGAQSFTDQLSL